MKAVIMVFLSIYFGLLVGKINGPGNGQYV